MCIKHNMHTGNYFLVCTVLQTTICSLFSKKNTIDATANTVFLRRGVRLSTKTTKTVDKQASGSHTHTLGREIKSHMYTNDGFELMTYYIYM